MQPRDLQDLSLFLGLAAAVSAVACMWLLLRHLAVTAIFILRPSRMPGTLATGGPRASAWLPRFLSALGCSLALSSPAAAQGHPPASPSRHRGPAADLPWSEPGGFPPPYPLGPTEVSPIPPDAIEPSDTDRASAEAPFGSSATSEDHRSPLPPGSNPNVAPEAATATGSSAAVAGGGGMAGGVGSASGHQEGGPAAEGKERGKPSPVDDTLEDHRDPDSSDRKPYRSHPAVHGSSGIQRAARLFPRAREGSAPPFSPTSPPPIRPDRPRIGNSMERAESMKRHPAGKGLSGDAGSATTGSLQGDRQAPPGSGRSGAGPSSSYPPRSHVVQDGDTLWDIAQEQLGTSDLRRIARQWPRIHRVNRRIIGPDPNLILPGQVLELPEEQLR